VWSRSWKPQPRSPRELGEAPCYSFPYLRALGVIRLDFAVRSPDYRVCRVWCGNHQKSEIPNVAGTECDEAEASMAIENLLHRAL
jgi:hypothetical protein